MIRTCLFLFFLFFNTVLIVNAQNDNASDSGQKNSNHSILNKKVTGSYKGVTVESVLEDLSFRYKINFSYVSELIPLDHKVYATVKNQPLELLLDQIFRKIPISYLGLEDQVILVKKKLADQLRSGNEDSVRVISITSRSALREGNVKISVRDLLKGDLKSPFSEEIQIKLRVQDSIMHTEKFLDSLTEANLKLRRARVKLMKSKEFHPKVGVEMLLRGELAYWDIYGAFDQSIDYDKFNNYHNPDFSYSETVSVRYRFFREFYIQPGIGSANIIRRGTHTDYLINRVTLESPQAVRYKFSSNFNYLFLTFEAGAGIRISRSKILFGAGYWQGIMVGKDAPEELPYFEPKYYLPGSPEVMNSRMEKLKPEKIEYKRFYPAFTANVRLQYKISEYMELLTEIHYRNHYTSIYAAKSSIVEKVYLWGVGLGLRVNML
jgi:hypothetical protein